MRVLDSQEQVKELCKTMRANVLTPESLKQIAQELESYRQRGVVVPISKTEMKGIIRKAEIQETAWKIQGISTDTPRSLVERILRKVDELLERNVSPEELGSSAEKILRIRASLSKRTDTIPAFSKSTPTTLIGVPKTPRPL